MIDTAKKVIGLFIRIVIVTFCFIMDVKVKADVMVEAISGQVEFESNHEILNQEQRLPFKVVDTTQFDVQTFENGSTRLKLDDKKVGMTHGSLFSVEKDGTALFSKGEIFFSF